MERWDDAEKHFEAALEMDERNGLRPYVVYTKFYYADMLVRRDGPGDRARALALVTQALDLAEEVGMPHMVERSQALQARAADISDP